MKVGTGTLTGRPDESGCRRTVDVPTKTGTGVCLGGLTKMGTGRVVSRE